MLMKPYLTYLLLFITICLLGQSDTWSQTAKPGPDVVILVQPQGTNALVAITYPRAIPHAEVRSQIARLAASGGWQVVSQNIHDQDLTTNPAFGTLRKLGTQTGATVLFRNATQYHQGAFILQPYLMAFSDLNRIDLWFMMGRQPGFTGLRHYESSSLSVNLIQEGAPYRYRITIHDRTGGVPTLPEKQPLTVATTQPTSTSMPSEPGYVASFAAAVAIAAAAGLFVLIALLLRTRMRATGTKDVDSRHTSLSASTTDRELT